MKRTMIVTLEIEVEDLGPAARKDAAVCEGTVPSELPSLKDATLEDFRQIIPACIEKNDEAFGGSMVYAAFAKATVTEANWKPERRSRRAA